MMYKKMNKNMLIAFLLFVVLILLQFSSFAEEEHTFTTEEIRKLWQESYCADVYKFTFDIEIYQTVPTNTTDFGKYKIWDCTYPRYNNDVKYRPECSVEEPYMIRTAGLNRGGHMEPDQAGKLYLNNRIMYAWDLGNAVIETLRICKKYGLNFYLAASDCFMPHPSGGTPIPFLRSDFAAYTKALEQDYKYQREYVGKLEKFVDLKFLNQPNQLWTVYIGIDTQPADFFIQACNKDFNTVNTEFKNEMGFDLPFNIDLTKPEYKAKRSKMWQWALARQAELGEIRTRLFRNVVAGQEGIITSHYHGGVLIDYEKYADSYDIPGCAVRPMLGSYELDYEYYTGYMCRLFNDMVDILPQISVRINNPYAGARVIPSPNAVKYWHSQAVQNGARLIYHWLKDYTPEGSVSILGQRDNSTIPKLRFNTILEISKKLGHSNIFIPPKSKTGIFVSLDTNFIEREGWFRNFSTYIELTQAGVWANFISDQELREQTEKLDQVNVLYLPMVKFEHPEQVNDIIQFVENGGTIITSDPNIFAYDDWGNPTENLREKIFGVVSLKKRTSSDNTIYLKADCSEIIIKPYSRPYEIEHTEDAEVIGLYNDGKAAAVCKKLGSGKAYFFAGSILDTYLHRDDYTENCRDDGRAQFLKKIETENNCPDLSWIWNINVDNVHKVTGEAKIKPVEIDDSIIFEWYQTPFMP